MTPMKMDGTPLFKKIKFFLLGMLFIQTEEIRQSPTLLWFWYMRGRATTVITFLIGVPVTLIFALGFLVGRLI